MAEYNTESRLHSLETSQLSQAVKIEAIERKLVQLEEKVKSSSEDHDLLITMKQQMNNIESTLKTYITRPEFSPVRMISFGIVAIAMSAVLMGLIALVLRPHIP